MFLHTAVQSLYNTVLGVHWNGLRFYKGTILQRNNNSNVKFHVEKIWEPQHDRVIPNQCYTEAALYFILRYSCEIFEETNKDKEALFNSAYLKQTTLAPKHYYCDIMYVCMSNVKVCFSQKT